MVRDYEFRRERFELLERTEYIRGLIGNQSYSEALESLARFEHRPYNDIRHLECATLLLDLGFLLTDLFIGRRDVASASKALTLVESLRPAPGSVRWGVDASNLRARLLAERIGTTCEAVCSALRQGDFQSALQTFGELHSQTPGSGIRTQWPEVVAFSDALTALCRQAAEAVQHADNRDFAAAVCALCGTAESALPVDLAESLRQACPCSCRDRRLRDSDAGQFCPGLPPDDAPTLYIAAMIRKRDSRREAEARYESLLRGVQRDESGKLYGPAASKARLLHATVAKVVTGDLFTAVEQGMYLANAADLHNRLRKRARRYWITGEFALRWLIRRLQGGR